MLKFLPTVIGCLGLITTSVMADKTLKTNEDKIGYTIGVQMGKQLLMSKEDVNVDALTLGIKDVFSNTKPKLTQGQMRQSMSLYQDNNQKKIVAMMKKVKAKGLKFLEENKKKKGVVTLKSGLQYKVLKKGSGTVFPKATDTVKTHYHGTLIDGTVFDSSVERGQPVSFPVNRVIAGWTEALQKMKVGDKWQLVIPSDLAYGERGTPPKIGPGATLVFDVELLAIN